MKHSMRDPATGRWQSNGSTSQKKSKPKKNIVNHIALVIDKSSSMSGLQSAVIENFGRLIDTISESQKQYGQRTDVTQIVFGDHPTINFVGVNPENVQKLNVHTYSPYGSTALLDAVDEAVVEMKKHAAHDNTDDDVSFLIIALTDGEENKSSRFGWSVQDKACNFSKMLGTLGDRWTVTFQVPFGKKGAFVRDYKVPEGNVKEWEQTDAGMRETEQKTSGGTIAYYAARSLGATGSSTFFSPDLSKLKMATVKKTLDDLSDRYKRYEVDKEAVIDEFTAKKTKRDYVIGQTFYQLMKKEKVQKNKQVLIMEKGKAAVWGGDEARDLIQLPVGADATVIPGNHANYDIFIASTSVNRKLPRGTFVLIDTKKTKSDKPTWDHTVLQKAHNVCGAVV
jgi:hypothetical protein